MVAVISDKASGRTSTVATSDISISRPSIIKLELSPTDISRTVRSGNDLVIDLKNGEQIRIDGFFTGEGDKRSELVLEDESGNVWNGDYTDALADFQFEPAGAVDQLVGGAAAGGGSVLGILGPLGLLGAVAAVAGGGGGGGGGDNGGVKHCQGGPKAPGVTLGDGDAFLNAEETAGGNVVVTISLNNTGAVAGDKLTVNGTTVTLTAAQIAAGEVEITLPAPADGQTLTVTASITDADGHTSPVTTVSAVVDTTPPTAPEVSLGDGDNVITGPEISNGQVGVRVDLAGTGAVAGDKLTVNGTTITLTAAQITAGVVTTNVTAPANGQTLNVSVTLTDAAGNDSTPTSVSAVVNSDLPGSPGVTLGDGDEYLNAEETTGGNVVVTISLGGTGAVAGDTLTVNGTTITLTPAQIAAGEVETTLPAPADGQTLTVTASVTDADGNTSPPTTVSAQVDTTPPTAPEVSLGDGDNVITGGEISNGQVGVRVDLAGTGAVAGDKLTVNGTTITLTAAQITAGVVTTNVTAPANGQTLNVSVTLTDAAGNDSTPTSVSAVVNSDLPGSPGVTLGDGDEYLNAEETAGGNVVVTISLGGTGAVAGDTLTVNGTTVTLTAAQIAAGEVETTLPAPADGQTLTVTASVTDADGNTSPPTTVSAVVDTTPPTAPEVSLGDGDNVITGPEISNGQVAVRVDLAGTGALAGDTLTVNGTTITLTAAQITAGVVTTNVTAPANGQTLNVSVTLTDAAGNDSTPTSVSALVDTDLPGSPVITIGDGDAYINASEITGGSVSISVSIANTGAVAGNTLTINGTAIVLTAAQVAAGTVETTLTAPADGQSLFVSATLTDSAGEVSPIATASALVDTTPPSLPTVTLGDGDAFLGTDEIAGGVVEISVNLVGTGAAAGDTLTVNGNTIQLTANDISTGVVTTTVTAPAEGQPLTVTTTLTDAAGNTSPPSTVTAVVDTTPPGVPVITLGDGDDTILADELDNGSVPVRIDLTGTNAVAGDTLTVNGTSITLTAAQVAAGVVNTGVPALNDGAQLTVTASLTDAAGNVSPVASASAVMNTELPGVPGITLGDGDDYINASEVNNGSVTVTLNLTGTGAVAGDILTINGTTSPLTATEIANGVATRPVTAPPDGETLTVTATITDGDGLTSPAITVSAPVDTSPPLIPTLTVGDGDGFITAGEISNGAVAVRVNLNGTGALEGDKLVINGTTITLTAAQITAGAVDTTVPAPANGQTLSVHASLTDIAGNSSPITTVSVVVDTTPPGQPVLTVGNGDGFITDDEITNGQVSVSVNIADIGAAVGDTLTVNGTPTVLTQAMITAGIVNTTVDAVGDGQTLNVQASITDAAGNTSPVSTVTALVDVTGPNSPIVTLGDGDPFINASEIVNGAVSVTISLTGTGAAVGDTVTVNGTPIVLTDANITTQSLVTSVAVPPTGETLTVEVSISDPAGNSSQPITITAQVDTDLLGMPSVTIGNGDAFVIADELVGGNIPVTIDISGTGAVLGDWLVVNGQIITLTQAQLDANRVETTLPVDGASLAVTVTLNDAAGNVSPAATASATVDIDAPAAPTVVLGDGDDFINAVEAAGGTVTVTVSIGGTGAVAGDRLLVNGTATVLTQAMITAGEVVTTVPAAANGQQLTVTAQLSDAAGNLSDVDTVSALTDTVAPTLPGLVLGSGGSFITVGDVVNDEVNLRVNIAGTGAEEGDTVTVNGVPTILQAADITNGFIDIGVEVPLSGEVLDVEVSLTDAAGNISPIAEVSATVDTIPPTIPTVTLGNGGDWLGIADITGGRATVSISLVGTGAAVGDTLTVNGQTIVLTTQMIDDELVTTTVPALADGQTLTVEAFLTDAAGNTSDVGSDTAEIDLTAPGQPLVTVGNGDGFINAVEATGGTVAVQVSLAGTGAVEGDTLIVDGVETLLTEQMIIDGVVPTTVPVLAEGPLSFDVTIRDQAGNSSSATTINVVVDTEPPGDPGVTLGNGDATIIADELDNGEVPVSISLLGTGAAIGDTLTVNGTTIIINQTHITNNAVTLTLPAPGDGQTLDVSATLTDAAGNVSGTGTATATINTGIPGAPTLTLGDGDGFITADEIVANEVTVRIDLAGTGATAGDILTVGGQTITLTQQQIDTGFLTTTVTSPGEGQPLNVTASIDNGGNVSATTSVTAIVDTIAPGGVSVAIGDGNGFIVAGEISNGSVTVTVNLNGAGAAAGDTLTVNGTTVVLTAAQVAAGTVQTSVTAPANGQTLTINASLADPAGNTSDVTTVSAVVDTTAPGLPIISIGDGDGFILPGEISGGNVTVSVSLAGTGAVIGDTLTINGTPTTLTAQDISTGSVIANLAAPANGGTLNVSASLTDAAGNSSPVASISAVVDTTVPTAPVVTLGNGDAYINAAEVTGGRVGVSININGSGAAAGDRLIVNGTTIVLTAAQIAAGTVATTVAAPTNGQTLTVNATITDASGNVSLPGTAVALVDTTVPTPPTLTIGNGDAFIGIGEISSGSVSISVSLAGTGAVAGDTLTVNGTSITLSAAQVALGTVATSVTAPPNGGTLNVSASITDVAGNTSTIANASAVVDTVAPTAPIVSLGNGDAYINASEVIGGSVAVSINIAGTGASAGDRLTINGNTVVLTAAQVAAGVYATTVAAPATGATLTVNAVLTDAAGNTSPLVTASATVDTTPPAAPTVSFLNDTGTIGDGISTDGTIRVSGIEPGARWEYSTNGGASWTLGSGPGFTLSAGSYGNVLVRQTDVAGNTSTRTVGPVQIINLVANDDATTIPLTINQQNVTQPKQTGAVGGVLNLGLLGNAVDVSLLAGQSPLKFAVADNTTQQVSVKGAGVALAALNLAGEQNYDLLVYRVEDGQSQAQLVHTQTDWLVFNPGILNILLPSWTGSTIALPQFEGGGTYYVVLANPGGVLNLSALANMTVETTSNSVTDYRPVSGSVSGNVLTGDITVAGTIVSSVDQTAVSSTGLVIHGDHGTLTIGRNGAYSYQPDPLYTGVDGDQDTFTYTIRSPDGSTSTAVLTITIDYPHGPQAFSMTASIEEVGHDDLMTMAMSFDDDTLDPAFMHASMHTATDNTDATDPSAIDGTDLGSDQPVFEDLLMDQGGQEIDLTGLTDTPEPAPSTTHEAVSTDLPSTVASVETTEHVTIDPFPASVLPEDQLHHVSVI